MTGLRTGGVCGAAVGSMNEHAQFFACGPGLGQSAEASCSPKAGVESSCKVFTCQQSHTGSWRSLVSCAQIRYDIKATASIVAWLAVTWLAISAVTRFPGPLTHYLVSRAAESFDILVSDNAIP